MIAAHSIEKYAFSRASAATQKKNKGPSIADCQNVTIWWVFLEEKVHDMLAD